MQRFSNDREAYGPEFDDRLIRLVRKNPAIYDVNHPHYRRNPVRVAIWDRIAVELEAPSKFLQTKWKNIRYNYLQEVKCLETGIVNVNIRKRRFTEDLSFLQHTAQTYNVKKGFTKNASYNSSENDNDSNSYMHADLEPNPQHTYEVIEIEHSDDGAVFEDESQNNFIANDYDFDHEKKTALHETNANVVRGMLQEPTPDVTIQQKPSRRKSITHTAYVSNPSSPLLSGNNNEANTNGEVTIEPISKQQAAKSRNRNPATAIMDNAAKRKAMEVPFPVLTPINDPIEMYCLSLVDSLRNMPRSERERVKYEFAKILKDAQYKDQC